MYRDVYHSAVSCYERWIKWYRLHHYLILIGILLVGFALRWYAAVQWNFIQPNGAARLVGDEPGYDNLGRSIWQGSGFDWPGRTPLYPLWLAGLYSLTDGSYIAVPYAQIAWGMATISLTYLLGRRLFGRTAGLLAALSAACSYTLIGHGLRVQTEIMYAPALLSVALTFWNAWRNPSVHQFLWLGFWIGVTNLIRPTLVLFPFFILIPLHFVFQRREAIRFWGASIVISTLTVTPWMVHNYLRHNAIFLFLAPTHAILWQGSPEYYHLLRDQNYSYVRVWREVIYGPGWQEHDPMSMQGDRWWTERALRSIAAEPHIYLLYTAEKLVTYWIGDPEADWNGSYVFDYGALRKVGFGSTGAKLVMVMRAIPIFAVFGILLLYRSWRRLVPIYVILLFCALVHAATHAEVRLSEPLQPLLLVVIAGAIVSVFTRTSAYFEGRTPVDDVFRNDRQGP